MSFHSSITEPSSEKHEEEISNMIRYTVQVKCKSWLELDLNSQPSGLRSTGLPIELSSQKGLEESFIHIKCTKYFHDDLNAIPSEDVQCLESITEPSSEKHKEKISNTISHTTQVKCKSWLELDLNSHLGTPVHSSKNGNNRLFLGNPYDLTITFLLF